MWQYNNSLAFLSPILNNKDKILIGLNLIKIIILYDLHKLNSSF